MTKRTRSKTRRPELRPGLMNLGGEDEAWHSAARVELDSGTALQHKRKQVVEEVALAVLEVADVGQSRRDVGIEAFHRPQVGPFDLVPAGGPGRLGSIVHRE